jgi:hypothetical protein
MIEEQPFSLKEKGSDSCLTYQQWLLANLGHKIGCQVWLRSIDHHKVWQNERLDTLSIPSLPTFAEPPLQQVLEQIDVIWLFNNEIVAAYEIESMHTEVSAGLLRLLDVSTLSSTKNMHLCMIISQDCFEKVCAELQRPIFQRQALSQRCELISQEVLFQHAEHILRWARNLFVIDDLASLSAPAYKNRSPVDHSSTNLRDVQRIHHPG